MARRSLRPHLNQIRGWVRQGRTDAWIAHQLEVTVQQIQVFKRENDLVAEGEAEAGSTDAFDEIDLRAEDDALIAAELEAAEAEAEARAEAEAEARAAAADDETTTTRTTTRTATATPPRPAAEDAAAVAGGGRDARALPRSRAPSTMARRATASGWTPPSRTTPSTPSTGQGTAPCRSPSSRTRSSSGAARRKTTTPTDAASAKHTGARRRTCLGSPGAQGLVDPRAGPGV